MKYWVYDGAKAQGPFWVEELLARSDFSTESLVCPIIAERAEEWKAAINFKPLREALMSRKPIPAPAPQPPQRAALPCQQCQGGNEKEAVFCRHCGRSLGVLPGQAANVLAAASVPASAAKLPEPPRPVADKPPAPPAPVPPEKPAERPPVIPPRPKPSGPGRGDARMVLGPVKPAAVKRASSAPGIWVAPCLVLAVMAAGLELHRRANTPPALCAKYLAALRSHDLDTAYGLLTDEFRTRIDKARFGQCYQKPSHDPEVFFLKPGGLAKISETAETVDFVWRSAQVKGEDFYLVFDRKRGRLDDLSVPSACLIQAAEKGPSDPNSQAEFQAALAQIARIALYFFTSDRLLKDYHAQMKASDFLLRTSSPELAEDAATRAIGLAQAPKEKAEAYLARASARAAQKGATWVELLSFDPKRGNYFPPPQGADADVREAARLDAAHVDVKQTIRDLGYSSPMYGARKPYTVTRSSLAGKPGGDPLRDAAERKAELEQRLRAAYDVLLPMYLALLRNSLDTSAMDMASACPAYDALVKGHRRYAKASGAAEWAAFSKMLEMSVVAGQERQSDARAPGSLRQGRDPASLPRLRRTGSAFIVHRQLSLDKMASDASSFLKTSVCQRILMSKGLR